MTTMSHMSHQVPYHVPSTEGANLLKLLTMSHMSHMSHMFIRQKFQNYKNNSITRLSLYKFLTNSKIDGTYRTDGTGPMISSTYRLGYMGHTWDAYGTGTCLQSTGLQFTGLQIHGAAGAGRLSPFAFSPKRGRGVARECN